jgi:hypothetical protein
MQSARCLAYFWMPLLKDVLDVLVWAGAFLSHHVTWRGERYRILRGGKLEKAAPK